MQLPDWFKTAGWGSVAGAIGVVVIGFSAGLVVTSGSAAEMVKRESDKAVLAALTPVCIAQFNSETESAQAVHLAALEKERSWKQPDYVKQQGWATMPGTAEPDPKVAKTCAKELLKVAEKVAA